MADRPVLFGVHVDPLTLAQTAQHCIELAASGRFVQQTSLNAGKVVLMHDNERVRSAVADSAVVSADGQSIVWAGRLLGVSFPERVAGIDLMGELLGEAERRGMPTYFLGARLDVVEACVAECRRRHPGLVVAGYRDGYFDNDADVAAAIRHSCARLLFVAMPSPRKELFLAEQREALGGMLAMGVGGSFDVIAGVTPRAPRWMQAAGLEWLFRMTREPGRMSRRYLVGNVRFLGMVLSAYGKRLRSGPR